MKRQKNLLYLKKNRSQPVEAALLDFIRVNLRRAFSIDEVPQHLQETIVDYRSSANGEDVRLLSTHDLPQMLSQGHFMFWPTGEGLPYASRPDAQIYSSTVKDRPIGIDLFAGAGGLSLGFEQAGFDVAACVEIDPIHCATHEFNFPYSASICGNVIDLTGDDIRRRSSIGDRDIDVVFGGAPCQGFSMIGKRALEDPRNRLVSHFVRLVQELQPKYCVFENVKGLTVGRHVQFLVELISALEATGYHVVLPYHVLNAADYGVPQNRFRLFLMAYRDGQKPPVYPVPHAVKVTVEEAISDLPDANGFESLLHSDSTATVWKTEAVYAQKLRTLMADKGDLSYQRIFDPNMLTSSLRTTHTAVSEARFTAAKSGTTEPISRFYKLAPAGQCNTLRAGTDSARGAFTSPRPIHPTLPRVITVREAARLHSYPDWFRFHTTKWHGFRQIGNSVPPLLGRAIASEISRVLGVQPAKPDVVVKLGDSALLSLNMHQAADHFGVPTSVIGQRTRKKEGVPI